MKEKKSVMGRGLGAILSSESTETINSATDEGAEELVKNIVEIPLEDIYPNENQPRTTFNEKALEELAASIRSLGIIQPVTLRKEGKKFEIISGERRYRAAKIAGLKTVPAYIRLVNDREMLEMALVENIQREDLDAIEVALTYQRLLEEIGTTQEELSAKVGKERSTITNSVRLLKLSPAMQSAIRKGEITAGHGRALLSLSSDEDQQILFEKIIKDRLSVRQSEQLAQQMKQPAQKTEKQPEAELPNYLKKFQKKLSDSLDINVGIRLASDGKKGRIMLDFNSEEELSNIIKHFKL